MSDIASLGVWAEALDDKGQVLGLGKLWPGEKQRVAVIREGFHTKTRITMMNGEVRYPPTQSLYVHMNMEMWLTWIPAEAGE